MNQSTWPDCINDGYFVNECLHPGYVVRERMENLAHMMANAKPSLTSHQIRRFFQHCRAIEARLRAKTSTWGRELTEFKKLDVAVADAFGKSPPKVPEIFRDFIQKNVLAVKTEKDFLEGFLPHFEALVGFGSAYFRSERN
ncbi:hypothetical protein VT84_17955 [Gemmata sp. SH-PL17]|uniref:type III-A CRISPR-associated protein Csm2 n=1 Tax=Gemmata sp. SH-PL17 TaxID=1630693 RepID=UPI00078BAD82|nr:type III-A CRISPR-associated protein Csm2 [Gemmata sp. SH-PL17]AMV26287.1 hypothetical protein VT84_17955 [Gemmata sp. SH-PL17]